MIQVAKFQGDFWGWSKNGWVKHKHKQRHNLDRTTSMQTPEGCVRPFKGIAKLVGQSVKNTPRTIAQINSVPGDLCLKSTGISRIARHINTTSQSMAS